MCFAHGGAGQLALIRIQARPQLLHLRERLLDTEIRDLLRVGHRCVVQRLCRRSRECARHVRHAVVYDALFHKGRFIVCCRARGLRTAALVDGNIDKHGPGFHIPQHFALDKLGRLRARQQHRADKQIHRWQNVQQILLSRSDNVLSAAK